MAEMMRVLLEDRNRRELELREERKRRDEEMAKREEETRQQMELLRGLLEGVQKQSEATLLRAEQDKDVKVAKLTSEDDIEAYLTTFERLMKAHNVKKERWIYKLTPHLTGKAQQAYVAISQADAEDYDKVKAAILRRYDVTEESYRRRFREAKPKQGETHRELSVRLEDLVSKWLKKYKSIEEIKDQLVKEQLLKTLPEDVCIFVREGKPETSEDVCRLADNYVAAHQNVEKKVSRPRCTRCKRIGHVESDCRQLTSKQEGKKENGDRWKSGKPKRDLKDVECYNCHQKGHYSANCPSNAMFCRGKPMLTQVGVKRAGVVEGNCVDNILLDTGCSKTLVRQDLVPKEKLLEGEAIAIRCAHGDTVLYPLAQVEVTIGGQSVDVTAAVSETLPMDVLLGTDVPELGKLLGVDLGHSEALAVTTRAQAKQREEQEKDLQQRDLRSEASVTGIDEPSLAGSEWLNTFDEELFEGGRERTRPSRSQKRAERQKHWEPTAVEEERDTPLDISRHALDISAGELKSLQEKDASLDAVRKMAEDHPCSTGVGFFLKDGLLYRLWTPAGRDKQDLAVEQLVVPAECRRTILKLAHDIPLSGHLGKEKTAKRILQRFYWPTLYRDVATYCRTCTPCQKTSHRKPPRAPLHPLPIITEPFSRIAMDIIGPLPRSHSGKRYVLVICDYATRYPEAIPLRSIDAEHVAEELVVLFSRIGIPKEILTDQGSNFTSQLLTEIYRLLHVHPITPHHSRLVENLNQTSKSMLRKAAIQQGKNWNKLIPYLLFVYREVPQAFTGFSPF